MLISIEQIGIMKDLYSGPKVVRRGLHHEHMSDLVARGYAIERPIPGTDDAEYSMTYEGNVALNQCDDDFAITVPPPDPRQS